MIAYAIFAVLLIISDQLSKLWAQSVLKGGSDLPFLPGILEFSYVENTGIAFGMLQGMQKFVLPLSVIIVAGLVYLAFYYHKKRCYVLSFSLVAIISGAIGNIIDKLRLHYVIDFLHTEFIEFPVFNLADVFICVGAFVIAIYILFFDKEEKNDNHK